MIDGGSDGLEFDERVVNEVDVDGREFDRMVNKKRHPTSSSTLAVLGDEVVARERRNPGVGREFGFLDGCDADLMAVEKIPEIVDFIENSVAIPL